MRLPLRQQEAGIRRMCRTRCIRHREAASRSSHAPFRSAIPRPLGSRARCAVPRLQLRHGPARFIIRRTHFAGPVRATSRRAHAVRTPLMPSSRLRHIRSAGVPQAIAVPRGPRVEALRPGNSRRAGHPVRLRGHVSDKRFLPSVFCGHVSSEGASSAAARHAAHSA